MVTDVLHQLTLILKIVHKVVFHSTKLYMIADANFENKEERFCYTKVYQLPTLSNFWNYMQQTPLQIG